MQALTSALSFFCLLFAVCTMTFLFLFPKPSCSRPSPGSPSATPRHWALLSPSLQRAAHLQAVTGDWLTLTMGTSPSGTPAPTPPPLPSIFRPNCMALDSLASPSPAGTGLGGHSPVLSPHPISLTLKEGHFIPIGSYTSPDPSPSPQPYLTSASFTPSPISPTLDLSPKRKSVIELPLSCRTTDALEKELPFSADKGSCGSDKSDTPRSCSPVDLIVYEPQEGPMSAKFTLPSREAEEDVCEELVSIIQASLSKSPAVKEASFNMQALTMMEELPRLFIEEDLSETSRANSDIQSSNTFTPVRPAHSEMSEFEAEVSQNASLHTSPPPSQAPLTSTTPPPLIVYTQQAERYAYANPLKAV